MLLWFFLPFRILFITSVNMNSPSPKHPIYTAGIFNIYFVSLITSAPPTIIVDYGNLFFISFVILRLLIEFQQNKEKAITSDLPSSVIK